MLKFSRSLPVLLTLATALTIGMAACQKYEAGITIPSVTDPGVTNGLDTIYLGDSLKIAPTLGNVAGVPTYQWLVNGVEASTDSAFTFKPTANGDYTISFKAFAGNSLTGYYYRIKVFAPYENGYYILNEGSFPNPGSLNFFRNGEDTMITNIFARLNPGKTLGTTSQYGQLFNGKLYMVSKQGAFVAADANTLKETGRIASLPADGRAFCGIDNSRGLVTTADGVYAINLQTLTLGAKVAGITGQTGGILKTDNYVFVLTEAEGVVVLNATDFSIVKKVVKADVGFARSQDGNIWAASGKNLYAINEGTLAVKTYAIPVNIYDSWGYWNAGSLSAAKYENAIYFSETDAYGSGTKIYKFVPGIDTTLTTPLVKLPDNRILYGAGVRYNSKDTTLIVTALTSDYQSNTLLIYNAMNGTLKKTINYPGLYFPSMPVSN
ncbi:DUF5074 domain-containing protein [Chitinophaga sp. sic0106]|uniref:DUF5074 domain-containing protein n=1 Tax=Chitinophaga sp. sic0106 TaxID=2854785 RepID=UPI001C46D28E|nr:DUF5074 domain-containing protein [Chitinophaga sp. sic0106]MBV7533460.1 DUF5074 domain-containing protein [Chitinophaga sp. sic0106]